jgi:hypothetical protein
VKVRVTRAASTEWSADATADLVEVLYPDD